MKTRSILASICIACYLVGSSVFSHVLSMNLLQPASTVVEMSDCGMMMQHTTESEIPQDDCFENCFGDYDDLWATNILVEDAFEAKFVQRPQYIVDNMGESTTWYLYHPPPDERCLHKSVNTPYFSHTTTTKLE